MLQGNQSLCALERRKAKHKEDKPYKWISLIPSDTALATCKANFKRKHARSVGALYVLRIYTGTIIMQITANNKKPKRKTKEEYVREIIELSESKGIDWNRNNLKDKTTIPNLQSIIALLKA